MGLTPFDIEVSPANGRVTIDGVDVSQKVRSITVQAEAREIPEVHLVMLGTGRIEGEGIVTQYIDLDQREVVLEWLGNIDPVALEAEALAHSGGLLGGMSTGEAFLAVLKGLAGGDDNGA